MNDKNLPVIFGTTALSKENVELALKSDPRNIDAAVVLLGEEGFFKKCVNPVYVKLYQFVTGIDLEAGQQKWKPKSLQHRNANKVFRYDCKALGFKTPVDIGYAIVSDQWSKLGKLLESGFEPPKLDAQREKTVDLEGVVIVSLKGKAVKIFWNDRYVWIPRSKVKFKYETSTLTIPLWIAKTKNLI